MRTLHAPESFELLYEKKCAYCKDYNNGATHVFECTHPDHRRYAEEGTELHSPNWFCADGETKEKETDD